MKKMTRARLCLCACLTVAGRASAQAQIPASSPTAMTAMTIPAPTPVSGPVHADTAALAEIAQYESAAFHPTAQGMTLVGTVTIGAAQTTSYAAQFTSGEGKSFRFDVHSPHEESLRGYGNKLARKTAQGQQKALPGSIFGGPFVTPDALKSLAGTPAVSIADRGTVTVDGRQLRKVTLSESVTGAVQGRLSGDLYFDPGTHLLAFSVTQAQVEGRAVPPITRVIEYEGYSIEEGVSIPRKFTEIDGGRVGFVFNVKQASFNSSVDNAQFHF